MGDFSINGSYSSSRQYEYTPKEVKNAAGNISGFSTRPEVKNVDWKEMMGVSLSSGTNDTAAKLWALAGITPPDSATTARVSSFAQRYEAMPESVTDDLNDIEETAGAEVAYNVIKAYSDGSAQRYELTGNSFDLLQEAGFTPEEAEAFMYATQV